MGELKRKILNILFWILLVIGLIMIIWKIFGKSPSDVAILIPFIVMLLIKIWSNSDRIRDVGYQVKILSMNTKSAFEKVRKDMNRIENKIDGLSKRRK